MDEIESRWRLVEAAWDLGLNTSLVRVDDTLNHLVSADRRRSITSVRHALNGYQKGVCFYCYCPIGIRSGDADLAEVDHVFPHVLQRRGILPNLDAVWNLVLACLDCNRGEGGKSALVPALDYVRRLHTRNEYLIGSAHPLRETLILQTGPDTSRRRAFLQNAYNTARQSLPNTWRTVVRGTPRF